MVPIFKDNRTSPDCSLHNCCITRTSAGSALYMGKVTVACRAPLSVLGRVRKIAKSDC